jgi:acyl-CoA synthetase (AMP-forming)/AMP-acid ligase II
MLLEHPDCAPDRLVSLRRIIAGGAEAPGALHMRMKERLPDVDLVIAYGSTETGHVISQQPRERSVKPGSLGRIGPRYRLKVFTAPGDEAAPGEIGEIATFGPHLLDGYLGEDAETAAYFKSGDGWGWTGDLGFIDKDGVVTLAGRAKDLIISGGINVYPAEIETPLMTHPDVADCAAFGLPDEKWGELPAAAVVLRPEAQAGERDLIDHAARSLARFKRPRRIFFVAELPRTAGGKILRARLWELAESRN